MPTDGPYGITFGLNFKQPPASNFPFWSNFWADQQKLGFSWLRFQLDWKLIQLNETDQPSQWSWGPLDDAVQQCNTHGVNICFPIRGEPSWALKNPLMRATNESGVDTAANNAPQSNSPLGDGWYLPDPQMMRDFAVQVATRYNGVTINLATGQPYGTIQALEFGNELFNIHFTDFTPTTISPQPAGGHWVGIRPSPYAIYDGTGGVTSADKAQPARDGYFLAQVLIASYASVKAVNPSLIIVMGAIWWTQGAGGNYGSSPNTVSNHTAFMSSLYAYGARGCWDVTNYHFYSNTVNPATGSNPATGGGSVNSFSNTIRDIQAVQSASPNNEPHKPVWLTEFGWQQFIVNTTSSTPVSGPGVFTITVGSSANLWPNMQLFIDSGTNKETIKITSTSGPTITATFANAHSGTYSVTSAGDAPLDGSLGQSDNCVSRLQYVLDTARTSGVITKVFYFTLNYQQTVGTSLASLVQWGYNQDPPTSYVQMPIYSLYKSYIASNPSWGTSTGGTSVRDVATRLNLVAVNTVKRDISTRMKLQAGTQTTLARDVGTRLNLAPFPVQVSLLSLTDSVAQAISDYRQTFVSGGSSAVQALATILSNMSGTGAQQTMGRLLTNSSHPLTRALLLGAGEQVVVGLSSLITRVESMLPFYQQFYPFMDALEQASGGMALYLANYANFQGLSNFGIVNANFAAVFNAYAAQALALGYVSGADVLPDMIPNWLIFPYADVDPLYSWTCGSGNAPMLYQAQGTTMTTFGGGTAPFSLYKVNAKGAIGGATFAITYQTGQGITQTATYTTTASLGGASSLRNGSVLLPIAGSAILSVSGTGMTLGEQYAIGAKLVRPSAY